MHYYILYYILYACATCMCVVHTTTVMYLRISEDNCDECFCCCVHSDTDNTDYGASGVQELDRRNI
jgi:hypothetical protein